MSAALAALRARFLAFRTAPMGATFPNPAGNVYTVDDFATRWQKLMVAAIEAGRVKERFNFNALRTF